MRAGIFFLALLSIFAMHATAQTVGENASPLPNSMPILVVHSELVTETVTVKGKDGKSVLGLTTKDFKVTEDGVSQRVNFCEHETLPVTPLPQLSPNQANISIYRTLVRTQITPEQNQQPLYRNHRLIALYFDMSAMNTGDIYRSIEAAEKFIRTQMTSADLVSIMSFRSGSVEVLQDFTANRTRLLSILTTLEVGPNQPWATKQSDSSAPDTGAAFGQDDSEFNIFNTDRQLAALQTASEMLGHLQEKKILIYFAGGIQLNGIDNEAQLNATVDAAIRANVTFWPIDARGLVAEAPLGDATQGSQGGISMYTGASELAIQNNFDQSQDTLYALGADTGGHALLDTNDLARGIYNAQKSVSDYYILGYYTTNTASNGRFRHIKITVNIPGVKLQYRRGYFGPKVFAKFNDADRERQLEDALMLQDPITDLSLVMELDYFQIDSAEYFVPVTMKIPGSELVLAKRHGATHALIDFIGEVKDAFGGYTEANVRDHMDIALSQKNEAQLAQVPLVYNSGFTLLPGAYKIKLLARDDETGHIGTFETSFKIPDLAHVTQHVPMSAVILTSELVAPNQVLGSAMKDKAQEQAASVNPMIVQGVKLIPSVTRVFNRETPLDVYLQGYSEGVAAPKPLVAYVALYRNGKRVYTSAPQLRNPSLDSKTGATSFFFTVNLKKLTSGTYTCQVVLLNPDSGKSSFWNAFLEVR